MSEMPLAPDARARQGAQEAVFASLGLLFLLMMGKTLKGSLPGGDDTVFTAAVAFQLYVPLWLIQRGGELPESHRINVHGALLGPIAALRKRAVTSRRARGAKGRGPGARWLANYGRAAHFRPQGLARDLATALVVAVVTFPLFAIGHHFYRVLLTEGAAHYTFTIPKDFDETVFKNVFLVALPEELFYRGFFETRLERLWPTKRVVLGIPLGRAVFLGAFLFALGHFLGEWNPARLGPFFPAFVFSALARKNGSITGAVLYHGLANGFSAFLFAGYH